MRTRFDAIVWHKLRATMLGTGDPKYEDFVEAGYPIVTITDLSEWPKIHVWCNENIQPGHYTWCGSRFIFVNEEDAVKFSLAWT